MKQNPGRIKKNEIKMYRIWNSSRINKNYIKKYQI